MSNVTRLNKNIHKWLSLFVGVQLIIWLVTGLYFNLMDHEKASGNLLRKPVVHAGNIQHFNLLPIDNLTEPSPRSLNFIWILGKPYYELKYSHKPHSYQYKDRLVIDATNGERYKVTEDIALKVSQLSLMGYSDLLSATLVSPPIDELPSQQNELWKVSVNNQANTHIYIDALTARVVSHVDDDRRLRDFMFMLHFMDYGKSGGFNHWLSVLFAVSALILSLTGVMWLVQLLKNKQLTIKLSSKTKVVVVTDNASRTSSRLALSKRDSVLSGLARHSINLPSKCGGGGTCGQCKFLSKKRLSITDSERALIERTELSLGYRLGCQHKVEELDEVEVCISA